MEKFLTLTVSGAVTGAIYSLVAAGLVLSYSATGIFNFSYGAAAFSSAYVYFELNTGLHWPIVPAALVTIFVYAPLLGWLLDRAVFRPLARATESAKVMATVGLLIALPALTRWLLDTSVSTFDWGIPSGTDIGQVVLPAGVGPVPRSEWTLPGGVPLDSNQLSVFIVAAVCSLMLWYLMRHTTLGLRMRAVVDRADLATTRGIDERHTSRWAWIIGMILAAIAGVVGSPIIGALSTFNFTVIMFVAAAAAVIGGLRSIPYTFAGGLLLGVTQNLVFGYADFAKDIRGFNSSVPFFFLLIGLALLARDRTRRGGSAAEDVPPVDYTADLPPWRRALPWVIAVTAFFVYVFVLADDFWVSTMATGLALGLVFLSFTVVTGLGGMVSLAQASFVSAAALTAGLLVGRYDWPFLLALLGGVVVATVVGVAVALPALRLGGVPLALATLALALLGDQLLFAWDWLRNENSGWTIERPELGPFASRQRSGVDRRPRRDHRRRRGDLPQPTPITVGTQRVRRACLRACGGDVRDLSGERQARRVRRVGGDRGTGRRDAVHHPGQRQRHIVPRRARTHLARQCGADGHPTARSGGRSRACHGDVTGTAAQRVPLAAAAALPRLGRDGTRPRSRRSCSASAQSN